MEFVNASLDEKSSSIDSESESLEIVIFEEENNDQEEEEKEEEEEEKEEDGESKLIEKQNKRNSEQKPNGVDGCTEGEANSTTLVVPEIKTKRKRKLKTTEQRKYLKYYYEAESQFPTKKDRHQISADLRISFDEVTQWFHNQRAAERKKAREEEQTLTMVSIQSWENIYRGGNAGRRKRKI